MSKGLAIVIAGKEKPKMEDDDSGVSEAMGSELMDAISGKDAKALVQIIRDIASGSKG